MDLSKPEETPGIIRIASAKRKLRLSPRGKPCDPQPKPPKIHRKNKKYIGVFFEKQCMFLSIQIELQVQAKTIRKITEDTLQVKCKTTAGTKWIYGRIVAHGGKFTPFAPGILVCHPESNLSKSSFVLLSYKHHRICCSHT